MKTKRMRIPCFLLSAIFLLSGSVGMSVYAKPMASDAASDTNAVVSEENKYNLMTYEEYAAACGQAKAENVTVDVDVTAYSSAKNVEKNTDGSVRTDGSGYIQWNISIPQSGWYAVSVTYIPVVSATGSFAGYIERTVQVDGKIPYDEAQYVLFKRTYQDDRKEDCFEIDDVGDDLPWAQKEIAHKQTRILTDASGYVSGYLNFYLEAGTHTFGFVSEQGAMDILAVRLFSNDPTPTYEEYLNAHTEKKSEAAPEKLELRAELPTYRSDYTISPLYDTSSSATTPIDVSTKRLNTIGGERWGTVGQWIGWEFNVKEDGWYTIGLRSRQNVYAGTCSYRCVYIDDVVPFEEAKAVEFKYSDEWVCSALGDDNGAFRFWLTAGTHMLKLEVVLGAMSSILQDVSDVMTSLNKDYLDILVYTGATPDEYRDYDFEELIPDVLVDFEKQYDALQEVCDHLQDAAVSRGQITGTLDQALLVLDKIIEDPDNIATQFSSLKDNISALGTWITTYCQQPLEIDTIYVYPEEEELPPAKARFWANLWFQVRAFFATFTRDYSFTESEGASISVWVSTGSEQAAISKRMAREMFETNTGIKVDLQLVSGDSLLPSVLAGISPDVCLGVAATAPIDFALRGAVEDLSQFADFDDVCKRFHASAITPFAFNGCTYALPETQSFPVMFYRKDVLYNLGISVPRTWEDVYALIPILQTNNMEFGLTWNSALDMLLYQNGGSYYTEDLRETALYTDTAMRAFQETTDLYTEYSLLVAFDFANRFRDGSMPLAIADFTSYNTLAVFAPEIKGMWGMAMVPGTVQEDGTINNTAVSAGSGVIMMSSIKEENKAAAWEFIKWWTSSDAQIKFAVEMESILGASAKQPSSNIEAFSQMSWPAEFAEVISQQREKTVAVPNIPGGYYLSRTLDFAFNTVYAGGTDSMTALEENLPDLNAEIARKRKEFGLN